jgi:xylulokinase
MNQQAAQTPIGADGLTFLPFGNGAERVLENRLVGGHLQGLNFNTHSTAHVFRAAQEGIVFALNYGLQVMQQMGVQTQTVRAGHANLFLSPLFREAFANTTGASIELYDTDGAQGAARAAGIGVGVYDFQSAFAGLTQIATFAPEANLQEKYAETYSSWEKALNKAVNEMSSGNFPFVSNLTKSFFT